MMSEKVIPSDLRETVIRPPGKFVGLDWTEIRQARYLFWNMLKRNAREPFLEVRHGVFWIFLRPLLYVFVFSVIRHASNARFQEGIPYPLFVVSGIVLWWYFVDAVQSAHRSLFKDSGLITKVYYPRIFTPLVPVLAGLVGFSFQMLTVVGAMGVYQVFPGWKVLFLPLVVGQVMFLSLGVGLLAGAHSIYTKTQDAGHFLKQTLYIGMFCSPVIYSFGILADKFNGLLVYLNPLAAPLEMFRATLFAGFPVHWREWGVSLLTSALVFALGLYSFQKVQVHLGDSVQ